MMEVIGSVLWNNNRDQISAYEYMDTMFRLFNEESYKHIVRKFNVEMFDRYWALKLEIMKEVWNIRYSAKHNAEQDPHRRWWNKREK